MIGLLLTAEAVHWPLQDLLATHEELTMQQDNVLRILRGAGRAGLPTLEIAERMIEHTPAVARLVDRLEKKGLVRRDRTSEDRRLVLCRITTAGLELLRKLDCPVEGLDELVMGGLDDGEAAARVRLLDLVRLHADGARGAR